MPWKITVVATCLGSPNASGVTPIIARGHHDRDDDEDVADDRRGRAEQRGSLPAEPARGDQRAEHQERATRGRTLPITDPARPGGTRSSRSSRRRATNPVPSHAIRFRRRRNARTRIGRSGPDSSKPASGGRLVRELRGAGGKRRLKMPPRGASAGASAASSSSVGSSPRAARRARRRASAREAAESRCGVDIGRRLYCQRRDKRPLSAR